MARKKVEVKTEDKVNTILPTRHRLKCKNHKQKEFSHLITEKEIIFATGPAGVGKSYVAIARAIELLQNTSNQYKKIILINPAVEADEKLGFIPGSVREKLDPYVGSSIDIIDKIVGASNRIKMEEEGILNVGALGFIRGKTIDNAILVMEEAQNMSPIQMKTLLTRIGHSTKFIISGDLDQSDRYNNFKQSGLYDAVQKHKNIKEFGFIEFDTVDIVRNPLITLILDNYNNKGNGVNMDKVIATQHMKPRLISEGGNKKKKKKSKLFRKIKIWIKKNFKW